MFFFSLRFFSVLAIFKALTRVHDANTKINLSNDTSRRVLCHIRTNIKLTWNIIARITHSTLRCRVSNKCNDEKEWSQKLRAVVRKMILERITRDKDVINIRIKLYCFRFGRIRRVRCNNVPMSYCEREYKLRKLTIRITKTSNAAS